MERIKKTRVPLLWRLLLSRFWLFWAVLCLCLELLFISAKITDLAKLIVQVGSFSLLFKYIGLQLILLFPVASAGSCLISMMSLVRELSSTMQLTAWRALGYSLRLFLMPLVISALSLSLVNFVVLSYAAPLAYRKVKSLGFEQMQKTPLRQLHTILPGESGLFIQVAPTSTDHHLHDLWITGKTSFAEGSQLIHINRLEERAHSTLAKGVDLISYQPNKKEALGFDHVVHEHYETLVSPGEWIKTTLKPPSNNFSLSSAPLSEMLQHPKWLEELVRRAAWAIAPLTCLFLGFALGMQHSRNKTPLWQRGGLTLTLALFFISLFALRKTAGSFLFLTALALAIHMSAASFAAWVLYRHMRGRR